MTKLQIHATMWMNLTNRMWSERSQSQRVKRSSYHGSPLSIKRGETYPCCQMPALWLRSKGRWQRGHEGTCTSAGYSSVFSLWKKIIIVRIWESGCKIFTSKESWKTNWLLLITCWSKYNAHCDPETLHNMAVIFLPSPLFIVFLFFCFGVSLPLRGPRILCEMLWECALSGERVRCINQREPMMQKR